MTARTFALVVFDKLEAKWLIEKTCELALAFDAHLIALHPYSPVIFYEGTGYTPAVFTTLQKWEEEESREIKSVFDEETRRNDIRAEFRAQETLHGNEPFLLSGARGADLVIMGSNTTGKRSSDDESLAERVIRQVGRPVLILSPDMDLGGPFSRIAVGWSETREATRAAHDALDFAKPGADVNLIGLVARASDEMPGFDSRHDFAAALDRRGFRATTTDRSAPAGSRGAELIQAANELNSDLLVAGAFGHSRFYDFMIGAVTSHLLKSPGVPVLLSR
ncbi:universal stress protein [Histidinibacterium aquaticum]|uniref:Universal stress protein n=1 Tax=Histidinibacterium aquaticum TaxID=2613962 RepID=A0A5J5GG35_9RHOB|nr:universal stress protein [Histidinibacterium aquaticum]KAA9006712.1 universal stress protein [Histidinibacterium aquaticum]